MKNLRKYVLLLLLLCAWTGAKSQILISLLFGDALNTEKIEFGLIGGLNRSYLLDIEESKGLNNFNIGFYFHLNMFKSSYLSTGVLVKSNVGAQGMPVYSIGDPDFDDVFSEGELTTKINYFYVPIMWHQRLNNNRWYIEGGLQLGLRNRSYDYFTVEKDEEYGGQLGYKRDVRDEYTHFDGGVIGGVGYKFKKEIKSMAVGVNYYYGLKNVSTLPDTKIKNSSVYIYMKIPIGTQSKDDGGDKPEKQKKQKKQKKEKKS